MSRFVPAGQSDLKTQGTIEQSTSTQLREKSEQAEIPSLYEQMRLNHEKKELEFRKKIAKKNSVFKIGEKDLEFYDKIRKEKESKEKNERLDIDKGLKHFEEQQRKKEELQHEKTITPITQVISKPLKNTLAKKPSFSLLGIKKKNRKTAASLNATPSTTTKLKEDLSLETQKVDKLPQATTSININLNRYSSDSESD